MMRSVLVLACGLCAFVLTCQLADRILPPQLPWPVRDKLTYLAGHGADFDAIFFGSSRVATHVIPSIFDRTAAEQGLAIKTFNAGIPGMFTPNDDYVLDRILASKSPRLRWVILELQPLQTEVPEGSRGTLEFFYWHDWTRLSLLLRRLAGKSKSRHLQDRIREASKVLPDLTGHAAMFVRRLSNLGRGTIVLQRWMDHQPEPPLDWGAIGENHDGWMHQRPHPRMGAQQIASLDESMDERRRKPPTRESHDPATEYVYETMVAKIRRAGATPVLMIPPNAARGTYFYPEPKLASQVTILDFCNPVKYPVLYETRLRVDTLHLTVEGAEIFSGLLARQFVEAVKGPPEK